MWLVYVAATAAYIYVFMYRPDPDYLTGIRPSEAAVLAGVGLIHVALGFVSRLLAFLAPLLPVVIAIPAGDYFAEWPEGPVWVVVLLEEILLGVPLIALGVAMRALADRRMRARATPRAT